MIPGIQGIHPVLGASAAAVVAAGAWQTMRNQLGNSFAADENGWTNYTLRLNYPAANLVDVVGATKIRVTVMSPLAHPLGIDKLYIGKKGGGGTYHFDGTQQQALWSGSGSLILPSGFASSTSDTITMSTIDGTADIVVALHFMNNATYDWVSRIQTAFAQSATSAYKLGDDASTSSPTGYTTGALLQDTLIKIEAST